MERQERSLPEIGKRLKDTRLALGMNQDQFARLAGIAQNTYNQWERGKSRPRLDEAIRLCDAHKLTLDWVYLGDASSIPFKIRDRLPTLPGLPSVSRSRD